MEERYIELAEKNVEDEREFGLLAVRRNLVAEFHEDFDGVHCMECDVAIPKLRLDDGKIRCTACQSIRESNIKRGIWVSRNQVKPVLRPAYMDSVVTDIRNNEARAANNELTRVMEQLARNVNLKSEKVAAIAVANKPVSKIIGKSANKISASATAQLPLSTQEAAGTSATAASTIMQPADSQSKKQVRIAKDLANSD